jgi:peptidoglycan/LPS O-acetylase OafA/YrhL
VRVQDAASSIDDQKKAILVSSGAMSAELTPGSPSSDQLVTRPRGDIQGLRAVAVLLVALDHAGVPFLKGGYVGVDAFFVLSGYLITGVLVRSARGNRRKMHFLSQFYGRRARRILPAAALTLAVTDIAATHLLNLQRAHEVLVDSISATFFVANIHFAEVGTNYFAMSRPPSPLQNFWSLSVEEQFYLVWPLLVAIAIHGIRLHGHRNDDRRVPMTALRGLLAAAAVITVASFWFAVYDTHHLPASAYFSTLARAWELGLGAVLALSALRVARLPPMVLTALGWAGLAAIVTAATRYTPSTHFPGAAALLPTLGAAALIASGIRGGKGRFAPSRVLSLRPVRYVGDRSYAFYLWHWPVLILAEEHMGRSLSVSTNLALLFGAFALSVVTYRYFENPIRHSDKLRSSTALVLWPAAIATVLFCCSISWADYQNGINAAITVGPVETLTASDNASAANASAIAADFRTLSPSALVASVSAVLRSAPIPSNLTPSALSDTSNVYHVPDGCISKPGSTSATICSLGDTASNKALVVFGDSHGQMWLPAIERYAEQNGYVVRPILKYSCNPFRWAGPEKVSECAAWYKWGVRQARALHPSILILGAHYDIAPREGEVEITSINSVANIAAFGRAVRSAAQKIVVLGDPPGQEKEPVDCLLASNATMKTCSSTLSTAQGEATASVEKAAHVFGRFLNTTPWLCYHAVCPMVIGHILAYVDPDHINTTYAEAIAPLFSAALTEVLAEKGPSRTNHKS